MGKAIAAICDLIESVVLDGWNATARLITVLAAVCVLIWVVGAYDFVADELVAHASSILTRCVTRDHPFLCLLSGGQLGEVAHAPEPEPAHPKPK